MLEGHLAFFSHNLLNTAIESKTTLICATSHLMLYLPKRVFLHWDCIVLYQGELTKMLVNKNDLSDEIFLNSIREVPEQKSTSMKPVPTK